MKGPGMEPLVKTVCVIIIGVAVFALIQLIIGLPAL